MPVLFPPDYPDRPDAPLASFGLSFSEEIARSVIAAVFHDDIEQPHETEVRVAASLTMLEAFHPRDHLECMMAAQGVAAHAAVMECLGLAMQSDTPPLVAIKQRAVAVQLHRMFSLGVRDLERRQAKPVPQRPGTPPSVPDPPPDGPKGGRKPKAPDSSDPASDAADAADPASDPAPGQPTLTGLPPARPRQKPACQTNAVNRDDPPPPAAVNQPPLPEPNPDIPPPPPEPNLVDLDDLPDDIETRPDGTPGSMAAYAPKAPVVDFIPREPPIMTALATRPKPFRMVNAPNQPGGAEQTAGTGTPPDHAGPHPNAPDRAAAETQADESETTRSPYGRGPSALRLVDSVIATIPAPPSDTYGPGANLDLGERLVTGDALSRFASARFDPDAPVELPRFDDDEAVVELELISTGGDPEAEAERLALIAAHPEGKPIVTIRYGGKQPSPDPPAPPRGKPPDT